MTLRAVTPLEVDSTDPAPSEPVTPSPSPEDSGPTDVPESPSVPTETPSTPPSSTPPTPTSSPSDSVTICSIESPCHVHVSDEAMTFAGVTAVLVVLLLAAILGAQLRRP